MEQDFIICRPIFGSLSTHFCDFIPLVCFLIVNTIIPGQVTYPLTLLVPFVCRLELVANPRLALAEIKILNLRAGAHGCRSLPVTSYAPFHLSAPLNFSDLHP